MSSRYEWNHTSLELEEIFSILHFINEENEAQREEISQIQDNGVSLREIKWETLTGVGVQW